MNLQTLFKCLFFLLFLNPMLVAQASDSIPLLQENTLSSILSISNPTQSVLVQDSPQFAQKSGFNNPWYKANNPSPKKAAWMSLLLPGSGQIYNKQYWKLPIVYAAYSFGVYYIINNQKKYISYKNAYAARVDQDDSTMDTEYGDVYNVDETVKQLRDDYNNKVDIGIIILVGMHFLQAADAFVFAHLRSFDIDDDLSLQIDPLLNYDFHQQSSVAALNFSLQFKSPSKEQPILFFGE